MRPIEFRGKSTAYNDWVYGDLLQNKNPFVGIRIFEVDGFNLEVDPDTVGQWTERYDKNKKKIYENDIVRVECHNGLNKSDPELIDFTICWDAESCRFTAKDKYYEYAYSFDEVFDTVKMCSYATIVGNIFDNPDKCL